MGDAFLRFSLLFPGLLAFLERTSVLASLAAVSSPPPSLARDGSESPESEGVLQKCHLQGTDAGE